MFRKLILFTLVVLSTINLQATSFFSYKLECSKPLERFLETARKLPEVEEVLNKILSEGPLNIELNNHLSNQFEGYWDPGRRTIYINKDQTEATRLTTLIFEMHNALRDKDFKELDHLGYYREISKKEYVERAEYIEYENALATSRILEIGVERGVLPPGCHWRVHESFEEHFHWMKYTGHAKWHANSYKNLS